MKRKIVFITNILRQPRCIRRINDFIDNGYAVKVYGFDRDCDNRTLPDMDFSVIDIISGSDSYPKRLLKLKKGIAKVIRKEHSDSLFYLFSMDVALAALLSSRQLKFIYEISDLMELQVGNKVMSKILVEINRWIIKKSCLNVYTSEGFVSFLNEGNEEPIKTVVLPNKLNKACLTNPLVQKKQIDINNIRFGFTGAIRTETIYRFINAIGELGQHEVHLFGTFTDENNGRYSIKGLVDKYTNVFYHGTFRNPDDFPEIYGNIDILLCYYNSSRNDLYLEPNKLYEAIFYECPIIVAANTFVGNKVSKLGIGYMVDNEESSQIKKMISEITIGNYQEKIRNIKAIGKDYAIDDTKELFDRIRVTNLS